MILPVLKPGKTWANGDSGSPEQERRCKGEQRKEAGAKAGGNVEVRESSPFQARTNSRVDIFCGDRNNTGRPHLLLRGNREKSCGDATEWV